MKRHGRRVWLASAALVFWLVPPAGTQAPAPASKGIDNIDRLATTEYQTTPIGSLTIGIVDRNRLQWTKSYGYTDMEAKRPATRETVYRIGSITKQFTGLMLLQLAERGRVRLTDPVEKYLPDLSKVPKPYEGALPITLLQLATMTSGLAREPTGPADHSVGPVAVWEQKVAASLPLTRYAHESGTRYLYSNIGYATLGVALGRAAGKPYTDYVRQHITAPLGMTHTAFEPNDAIRVRLGKAYVAGKNGEGDWQRPVREFDGRGYRVPNGALFSTVDDLARFVVFELGEGPPEVLKKETLEDNFSRVYTATSDLTFGYGLGFRVIRRGTLVAYGHGGSTTGYRSAALFDRRSKFGVIVLRSAEGGGLNVEDVAIRALEMLATTRPVPPP